MILVIEYRFSNKKYSINFKYFLYIIFRIFQGAGQDRLGIYIKSVVTGGAADAVSKYYLLSDICIIY